MSAVNIFLWISLVAASLVISRFISVYNQAEREARYELAKIRQQYVVSINRSFNTPSNRQPVRFSRSVKRSEFLQVGTTGSPDQRLWELEYHLPAAPLRERKSDAHYVDDFEQHGCA